MATFYTTRICSWFVVLSKEAIFLYKVFNYNDIESELGIIYNGSNLNIDWDS